MPTDSGTCARRDGPAPTVMHRDGLASTRRRGPGRLLVLLAAAVIALGLSVAPPLAPQAAAAAPELQITADATYAVLPDKARVHVTVDATVTNTHRDTTGVRTYFDTAFLAVLPGTANFSATSPGATPT